MKFEYWVPVLFFGLATTGSASLLAEPLSIAEFRNHVLLAELESQAVARLQAYRSCLRGQSTSLRAEESALEAALDAIELAQIEAKNTKLSAHQKTLHQLEVDRLLFLAESHGRVCAAEIREARRERERQERKKFIPAYGLTQGLGQLFPPALAGAPARAPVLTPATQLLLELDPSCASQVVPSYGGGLDLNPCFAGARIILGQNFLSHDGDFDLRLHDLEQSLQRLRDGLRAHIQSAPSRQPLNLASLLGQNESRVISMMALMTSYSTSANGYVSPYGLSVIRGAWAHQADALTAYLRYMRLKNLADQSATLLKMAAQHSISLRLFEFDVGHWNRHNWMSAALTLHYLSSKHPSTRALASKIPVWLGTVYESKDAISHLRGGESWRSTWRGFKTDRARYLMGARVARLAYTR
jgi:hypothetical protein